MLVNKRDTVKKTHTFCTIIGQQIKQQQKTTEKEPMVSWFEYHYQASSKMCCGDKNGLPFRILLLPVLPQRGSLNGNLLSSCQMQSNVGANQRRHL